VVVCTARLVRRKGQDTLIRVWPRVLRSHPDAVLLLVGDGPARRALERLAADLAVTSSVRFVGGVSWDQVSGYVDAGDVFAMPCRTRRWGLEPEAWGIVFLEARACGLPVVVGRSGGAPETLGDPDRDPDPDRGRVVTRPDEVLRALVDLLDARRPRTGEDADLHYTWDRAAGTLTSLWTRPAPGPRTQ
jgi:phosphatidylinositol alpha-1,6-mannosyltransferase